MSLGILSWLLTFLWWRRQTIRTVCRMVIRAMEKCKAGKDCKRRGYSIKQDDQRRLFEGEQRLKEVLSEPCE